MNTVSLPHYYFADPNKGRPLFNSSVYIGEPDLDPETNPKDIFYVDETGNQTPAPNPILTGAGGVIVDVTGQPAQVVSHGSYSMRVRDSKGDEIYYSAFVNNTNPLDIDVGDYESDPIINSYSQYVVFDRLGNPTKWKAKETTPLPYSIDFATYPTPQQDSNLQAFQGLEKAQADLSYDKHSTLAEAKADPVSEVGQSIRITDRADGIFDVVSGKTANGLDIVAHDSLPLQLELRDKENPVAMGIFTNGTDVSGAVANYLQINGGVKWPKGTTYISSLPDLATINGGNGIRFTGEGLEVSTVEVKTGVAEDILFNNFLIGAEFLDFNIKQVDAPGGNVTKIGKLFDSSASGAAFAHWDQIRTLGWDIVGEVRQSVWCRIGFLECKNYGLKPLCFVKSLKDGSAPTGGWNQFPNGWFNNALSVDNYLARGGVNGPVFEGSSIGINTMTTEGLSGNGLTIRGNNSGDKIKTFSIQNLYQENISGTSLVVDNVNNLLINSRFTQGRNQPTPATADMNINESNVEIQQSTGQDYYVDGAILTGNSTLKGESIGVFSGDRYVVDSTSKHIDIGKSEHVRKYKSGSLADGQSLTLTGAVPTLDGNYSLKIGVIYNGTALEVQAWQIWRFNSSTYEIQQSDNASTRVVTVVGSGDDLIVTNAQGAQAMVFTCTVVDESGLAFN